MQPGAGADGEECSSGDHREPLLLLCHRIPYPPNKGDKIRAWHLLKFLAQRYRIYLGAFVDDEEDWVYAPVLNQVCEATCFIPLKPSGARLRSLEGLLRGCALSLPYYRSKKLKHWVSSVCEQQAIRRRVVFSSAMGQFLSHPVAGARTVVDFVDVDSDKWRQYAAERRGLSAWVYGREARLLEQYERTLAGQADASLFVSSAEAEFFRGVVGHQASSVGFYSNGVDAAYFDPAAVDGGEHGGNAPELVFTGAMDYWPNVDAVCWFAEEVLPVLRKSWPELRFTIVGGKPSPAVLHLRTLPGVEVTGRVPDVRPYLARCTAAVAPMRVARGIQNKVLEAMAMGRPVLTSAMGLEGIGAENERSVLIANEAEEYVSHMDNLMKGLHGQLGTRARQLVLDEFSWDRCLAPVVQILEGKEVRA